MKSKTSIGTLITGVVAIALWRGALAPAQTTQPAPTRTLVFIVPGLAGNDGFWPNAVPGKVTFASELLRGAGVGTDIYSYLWNGSPDHASREAAAKQLAAVIDQKAASYGRVCLVGHSFGGDIALRASGLCQTKIDTIVCMATPHTYLMMQNPSGQRDYVPVYCTWESRQNTKAIVNLFPSNDTPIVKLANEYKEMELDEADAIPLTQSWQEHLGFPRLVDNSIQSQIYKTEKNLVMAEPLNVANTNIPIQSLVQPGTGMDFPEHVAIHSRRMGYVIGEFLREGPTPKQIDYLATMVQPKDSDQGEPAGEDYQQLWLRMHNEDFSRIGWRLSAISVGLAPDAAQMAHMPQGSLPTTVLRVTTDGPRGTLDVLYESAAARGAAKTTWQTDFILWNLQTDRLAVTTEPDLLGGVIDFGGIPLTGLDAKPVTEITADPARGVLWSAGLAWTAVHY